MEELFQSSTVITSPVFDLKGSLHFCSSQTGDIVKVEKQSASAIANTKCPNCIGFDKNGKIHICDLAEQAILTLNDKKETVEFVKYYEGKKLLGPNHLIFSSTGTIYFTDSGPIGESTIQKPKGSVFAIIDGELLQPLAYNCLAHPTGLALSPNENVLYVAETMKNRILRFIQKPIGVYHMTLFHQFSGNFGPTAIVCDERGFIYVANFDFTEVYEEKIDDEKEEEDIEFEEEPKKKIPEGTISVLSPKGKIIAEYTVPGTEITGLCYDEVKRELYITEGSTKTLYRMKIEDDEDENEDEGNEGGEQQENNNQDDEDDEDEEEAGIVESENENQDEDEN